MKTQHAKSFQFQSRTSVLIVLLFTCLLASSERLRAPEDPPGCWLCGGGVCDYSSGAIKFNVTQAHLGDTVQIFSSLGMVPQGCRASNVVGSIYIAAGTNTMPVLTNWLKLTNFLINVTIAPGMLISCPSNSFCQPGPYNLLIRPELVGAGVGSPNGSINGAPKAVRIIQNGNGVVFTGDPLDDYLAFHTATVSIVTLGIQVVERCAYPAGTSCFPVDAPIQFTGYVTNCGDIQLTNLTLVDSRSAQLLTTNGLPLSQPLTLNPGQAVGFQGSFQPTLQELATGSATNMITATARDTTVIGGPNAAVTNSTTGSCAICLNPHLAAPTYTADGQFQFNVAGRAGSNYVVQVSTNLEPSNWLSLLTNPAPFTFVESNATLYPARFYRAMFLP